MTEGKGKDMDYCACAGALSGAIASAGAVGGAGAGAGAIPSWLMSANVSGEISGNGGKYCANSELRSAILNVVGLAWYLSIGASFHASGSVYNGVLLIISYLTLGSA